MQYNIICKSFRSIQNDVIKCCKMMSHSNNCCVVHEPAICEDLDLHVAIFCTVFVEESHNIHGLAQLVQYSVDIFNYFPVSIAH